MTGNLQPYPQMRDSGMNWLGKVPEHWGVRKLRSLFRRHGSGTTPPEKEHFGGSVSWVMSGDLNDGKLDSTMRTVTRRAVSGLPALKVYPPKSLVVAMYGATIGRTGILSISACTNQACCVLADPFPDTSALFVQAVLVSAREELVRSGVGGGQPNINAEMVRAFRVPSPPRSEQTAIVRFLDAVDRRIRRYIRAKERLIELLEERKRALIHEAVTGRIDVRTGQPYPAYKDSGVEWLGKVPEHWSVRRNRWLFRERSETGFGSLPILGVSIHEGVRIRDMDDGQRKQQIVDRSQYKRARNGDIAYNTMRMWQGAVGVVPVDGLVSPAYVVACPVKGVDSRYYGYLLRTQACKQAVKLYSRGIVSDRDRLYWDEFKRIASPLPPQQEQTLVVEFLDRSDRRLQDHISATRRQIALLREYRTRLIADVVTGKLDVREAADLPETDPLAGNRDGTDTNPTELNLHPIEEDVAKEAVP